MTVILRKKENTKKEKKRDIRTREFENVMRQLA